MSHQLYLWTFVTARSEKGSRKLLQINYPTLRQINSDSGNDVVFITYIHSSSTPSLVGKSKCRIYARSKKCNYANTKSNNILQSLINSEKSDDDLKESTGDSNRMYSAGTAAATKIAEKYYEYKGYRIRKGTGLVLDISSLHNDPSFGSEPEKFKPDRFEDDYDKLGFLAFGIG